MRLLLSSPFAWMNTEFGAQCEYLTHGNTSAAIVRDVLEFVLYKWLLFVRTFRRYPPSGVLLVMWHPLNVAVALLARIIRRKTKVIIWLHEPYRENKWGYGSRGIVLWFVEFFQRLSLFFVDVVIVHSESALRAFRRGYPGFGRSVRRIPLLFTDEAVPSRMRQYVTFLGRASKDKGIDTFFELVRNGERLHNELRFQLVTSSDVTSQLQALPAEARGRVVVRSRAQLSDEEIRVAAGQSVAILFLHNRTIVQSGVTPVALMCNAPVICYDMPQMREFLQDGQTAVMLDRDCDLDELFAAIEHVHLNFRRMSSACRKAYLRIFDDGKWDEYYGWLRQLLTDEECAGSRRDQQQ